MPAVKSIRSVNPAATGWLPAMNTRVFHLNSGAEMYSNMGIKSKI